MSDADTRPSVPLLRISDLCVRYGGVTAVNGVTLEVSSGSIISLIGPNGAGKTSLFNAISGFVRPASGAVSLQGRRIDRLPPHTRARLGLGRTFQGGKLFQRLTVEENLHIGSYLDGHSGILAAMLGAPAARRERRRGAERAEEMLEAFDLTAVAKTTCSALPSGTQRVVEVMRALCARPKVLLLDEPSAGLDVHETQEFARTVRRIREDFGIPVLLIEHDMSLVMGISDYVYVIDFGNPLAEGTPSEVRANPAVVAAYLGQDVA